MIGWTCSPLSRTERDDDETLVAVRKRLELDVAEPDGLAFGLQGDVAEAELEGVAGSVEAGAAPFLIGGVELGALEAQDFDAIDAIDDLFVAMNFGFDLHPFIGGKSGRTGFHDVFGDEFAVDFNMSSGAAGVGGGARTLAFIGEELNLYASGEFLLEGHALRRL